MREYMPLFDEYIDTLLSDIRRNDPEGWWLFDESEESLVDDLRQNPLYRAHPDLLESFLEHHLESTAVRARAVAYFADRILSYWDWDREVNPQALDLKT